MEIGKYRNEGGIKERDIVMLIYNMIRYYCRIIFFFVFFNLKIFKIIKNL